MAEINRTRLASDGGPGVNTSRNRIRILTMALKPTTVLDSHTRVHPVHTALNAVALWVASTATTTLSLQLPLLYSYPYLYPYTHIPPGVDPIPSSSPGHGQEQYQA